MTRKTYINKLIYRWIMKRNLYCSKSDNAIKENPYDMKYSLRSKKYVAIKINNIIRNPLKIV